METERDIKSLRSGCSVSFITLKERLVSFSVLTVIKPDKVPSSPLRADPKNIDEQKALKRNGYINTKRCVPAA